jgi:ribonuclease BN (tRNA processing enzyme)/energy-coupling factor transporter ATP-binding protein EcfA2
MHEYSPARLVDLYVEPGSVVLFVGRPGSGKSTLLTRMADVLASRGQRFRAICADPGSPVFGPPGAVSLAGRADEEWSLERLEALATLNAGRYRLPVVTAVLRLNHHRLTEQVDGQTLLVDAPGVHRGVAARELLPALAEACGATTAIVLARGADEPDALDDLRALGVRCVHVRPSPHASSATGNQRAEARTARWDAYLQDATTIRLAADLPVTGSRPSLDDAPAWQGRQLGLLDGQGRTLALAEIAKYNGVEFVLRAPPVAVDRIAGLVARDARRNDRGQLRSASDATSPEALSANEPARAVRLGPAFEQRPRPVIEVDPGGAMSSRISFADVTVVGGLFEDPCVYARFRHGKRGLLFDMGEVGRMPPKLLHRVSDAFVTHAHFDHFAGFVDLVRRWVHVNDTCRVWGPPGLADQVEAMVGAFTWDRIGEGEGPTFVVGELDGDELRRTRIEAAIGAREDLGVETIEDGELLVEPRFRVRACSVEHGTTVLAYALEETSNYAVRSDRLEGRYAPGEWLGELKQKAAVGAEDDLVELCDGSTETVGQLAERLLIERPGDKIVYATDFADTQTNRERIISLAQGAKVLICEASFRRDDAEIAEMARHLTTKACAEIARVANVERLVPFHFSARYEEAPELLYAEILEVFPDVIIPAAIARRLRSTSSTLLERACES